MKLVRNLPPASPSTKSHLHPCAGSDTLLPVQGCSEYRDLRNGFRLADPTESPAGFQSCTTVSSLALLLQLRIASERFYRTQTDNLARGSFYTSGFSGLAAGMT